MRIAFILLAAFFCSMAQAGGADFSASEPKVLDITVLSPKDRMNAIKHELIGTLAPEFELERVGGGEKVKLSDFRGKYVLLDAWAITCAPCVAFFPTMKEVYDNLDKSKVEFVGICQQLNEDDDIEEYFEYESWPWTQLKVEVGPDGERAVVPGYQLGTPTYILIDPNGVILAHSYTKEGKEEIKDLQALMDKYVK